MSDYFRRFENATAKYFVRGSRNNNCKAVARLGVIYEIDDSDFISYVKGQFGADWTKSDERSFLKAWEEAKKDSSIVSISKYINDKKEFDFIKFTKDVREQEAKSKAESTAMLNEAKLAAYIDGLKGKHKVADWVKSHLRSYSKDSSFLLNVFSEDDLVWISDRTEVISIRSEVKDIKSFAEAKKPLQSYMFFSINPLRDDNARNDENIRKFKYMLLEADYLEKPEQFLLMIDMIEKGVPVKMVTFTGNRSLHILVKVNGVKTQEEWDEYVEAVFSKFDEVREDFFDKKCKNPSRLSRLPFGVRRIEVEDEFGDKKQIDVEQKLVYLQEDDEKLQSDARDALVNWADGIIGKEASSQPDASRKDVISDDELLSLLKDRDKVIDIWDDGCYMHTLMKSPYFGLKGEVLHKTEDMVWKSEKSFYNFIQQLLEEQWQCPVDAKALRLMKVRHKKHEKYPYIGERSPVRPDIVNIFIPGWLHKALNDDRIPTELNEPLEKLLNNIFGDQSRERAWTLQWMREFMHTFSVITAPVFWEVPGTGKTMLSKAFGEAIGDWIKTPPKKDDIQFNAWQDHTVIIFEESSSGSKRDGKDLGDLLKDWITEPEKTIEAKGKDPVKKTIKSCFIFNANISEQIGPVHIEDNDRRYTIIRNDAAVNLIDVWSREDFDRWDSGEYQMQLMKWIYNLPKDESVNIRRGLDSEWKHQVVELSKTQLELAVCEAIEMVKGFISSTDIMMRIKNDMGIMNVNTRAIGRIMAKLGYQSIVKFTMGKAVRGYELCGGAAAEQIEIGEQKASLDVVDVNKII